MYTDLNKQIAYTAYQAMHTLRCMADKMPKNYADAVQDATYKAYLVYMHISDDVNARQQRNEK